MQWDESDILNLHERWPYNFTYCTTLICLHRCVPVLMQCKAVQLTFEGSNYCENNNFGGSAYCALVTLYTYLILTGSYCICNLRGRKSCKEMLTSGAHN